MATKKKTIGNTENLNIVEQLLQQYEPEKAQTQARATIEKRKERLAKGAIATESYANPYDKLYDTYAATKNFNTSLYQDAIKFGEQDQLFTLLEKSKDAQLSEQFYDPQYYDYQTMMLELYKPFADDENLTDRTHEVYDESTGEWVTESIGQMTDRQWIDYQVKQSHDIRALEITRQLELEKKEAMSFMQKFGHDVRATGAELGEGALSALTGFADVLAAPLYATEQKIEGEQWGDAFVDFIANEGMLAAEKKSARIALDEYERTHTHFRDIDGNYTGVGKYAAGIANSIGMMIPSIVATALTGGAASFSWVGQATFYASIFTGNVYEAATNPATANAPAWTMIGNAAVKAGVEVLVEHTLNKFLGGTIQNDLIGLSGGAKGLKNLLGKEVTKKGLAVGALKYIGKSAAQEGLEEFLQDFSTNLVDQFMDMYWKGYGNNGVNGQTLVDSFVMGALSSLFLSGGAMMKNRIDRTAKNISERRKSKGEIRDAGETYVELSDGTLKKLNAFEHLYFDNLLSNFNSAIETLRRKSLKGKNVIKLAQETQAAFSVLSQFYASIGEERVKSAELLLNHVIERESRLLEREYAKKHAAEDLTAIDELDEGYSTSIDRNALIDRTAKGEDARAYAQGERQKAVNTYIMGLTLNLNSMVGGAKTRVAERAKKALEKNEEELKKNDVTTTTGAVDKNGESYTIGDIDKQLRGKKSEKATQTLSELVKGGYEWVFTTDGHVAIDEDNMLFVSEDWVENYTADQIREFLVQSDVVKMLLDKKSPLVAQKIIEKLVAFNKSFTNRKDVDDEQALMDFLFNESVFKAFLLREGGKNLHVFKNIVFHIFDMVEDAATSSEYLKLEGKTLAEVEKRKKVLGDILAKIQKAWRRPTILAILHWNMKAQEIGADRILTAKTDRDFIKRVENARRAHKDAAKPGTRVSSDYRRRAEDLVEVIPSYVNGKLGERIYDAIEVGLAPNATNNQRLEAVALLNIFDREENIYAINDIPLDRDAFAFTVPVTSCKYCDSADIEFVADKFREFEQRFGHEPDFILRKGFPENPTPELRDNIIAAMETLEMSELRYRPSDSEYIVEMAITTEKYGTSVKLHDFVCRELEYLLGDNYVITIAEDGRVMVSKKFSATNFLPDEILHDWDIDRQNNILKEMFEESELKYRLRKYLSLETPLSKYIMNIASSLFDMKTTDEIIEGLIESLTSGLDFGTGEVIFDDDYQNPSLMDFWKDILEIWADHKEIRLGDIFSLDKISQYFTENVVTQLRDCKVQLARIREYGGLYNPLNNTISLSQYAPNYFKTLIHECNHAIQEITGLGSGANIEYVSKQEDLLRYVFKTFPLLCEVKMNLSALSMENVTFSYIMNNERYKRALSFLTYQLLTGEMLAESGTHVASARGIDLHDFFYTPDGRVFTKMLDSNASLSMDAMPPRFQEAVAATSLKESFLNTLRGREVTNQGRKEEYYRNTYHSSLTKYSGQEIINALVDPALPFFQKYVTLNTLIEQYDVYLSPEILAQMPNISKDNAHYLIRSYIEKHFDGVSIDRSADTHQWVLVDDDAFDDLYRAEIKSQNSTEKTLVQKYNIKDTPLAEFFDAQTLENLGIDPDISVYCDPEVDTEFVYDEYNPEGIIYIQTSPSMTNAEFVDALSHEFRHLMQHYSKLEMGFTADFKVSNEMLEDVKSHVPEIYEDKEVKALYTRILKRELGRAPTAKELDACITQRFIYSFVSGELNAYGIEANMLFGKPVYITTDGGFPTIFMPWYDRKTGKGRYKTEFLAARKMDNDVEISAKIETLVKKMMDRDIVVYATKFPEQKRSRIRELLSSETKLNNRLSMLREKKKKKPLTSAERGELTQLEKLRSAYLTMKKDWDDYKLYLMKIPDADVNAEYRRKIAKGHNIIETTPTTTSTTETAPATTETTPATTSTTETTLATTSTAETTPATTETTPATTSTSAVSVREKIDVILENAFENLISEYTLLNNIREGATKDRIVEMLRNGARLSALMKKYERETLIEERKPTKAEKREYQMRERLLPVYNDIQKRLREMERELIEADDEEIDRKYYNALSELDRWDKNVAPLPATKQPKAKSYKPEDIIHDIVVDKKRYVSKNKYKDTNVKYFYKKSESLYMDPALREFIAETTGHEKEISASLMRLIKDGKLNKQRLFRWLTDCDPSEVNDFTFTLINKYFFANDNFKNMNELMLIAGDEPLNSTVDTNNPDPRYYLRPDMYWAMSTILLERGATIEAIVAQNDLKSFISFLQADAGLPWLKAISTKASKFVEISIDPSRSGHPRKIDAVVTAELQSKMRLLCLKYFDGSLAGAFRTAYAFRQYLKEYYEAEARKSRSKDEKVGGNNTRGDEGRSFEEIMADPDTEEPISEHAGGDNVLDVGDDGQGDTNMSDDYYDRYKGEEAEDLRDYGLSVNDGTDFGSTVKDAYDTVNFASLYNFEEMTEELIRKRYETLVNLFVNRAAANKSDAFKKEIRSLLHEAFTTNGKNLKNLLKKDSTNKKYVVTQKQYIKMVRELTDFKRELDSLSDEEFVKLYDSVVLSELTGAKIAPAPVDDKKEKTYSTERAAVQARMKTYYRAIETALDSGEITLENLPISVRDFFEQKTVEVNERPVKKWMIKPEVYRVGRGRVAIRKDADAGPFYTPKQGAYGEENENMRHDTQGLVKNAELLHKAYEYLKAKRKTTQKTKETNNRRVENVTQDNVVKKSQLERAQKELDATREKLKDTKEELKQTRITLKNLKRKAGNRSDVPTTFNIISAVDLPDTLKQLFQYSFEYLADTKVQFASVDENTGEHYTKKWKETHKTEFDNRIKHEVANWEQFFDANYELLHSFSRQDVLLITDAIRQGIAVFGEGLQNKINAIQIFVLGYIWDAAESNALSWNFSADEVNDIRALFETHASAYGSGLNAVGQMRNVINPFKRVAQRQFKEFGLDEDDTKSLFEKFGMWQRAENREQRRQAEELLSSELDKIEKIMAAAKASHSPGTMFEKGSFGKRFWSGLKRYRYTSMLSNPATWVRNKVSNAVISQTTKWSDFFGKIIFKEGDYRKGQWDLAHVQVSNEVRAFITQEVEHGKIFELLYSEGSKYDDKKRKGSSTFAKLLVKSLSEKFILQQRTLPERFIARMISDKDFVEHATKKYFGKILTLEIQNGEVDLSKGMSDKVLNLFADALVLANDDYMHKRSAITDLIDRGAERHPRLREVLYFWQPFLNSGFNWFAEAWKYTPIGLVNAIHRSRNLEAQITKIQERRKRGETIPNDRLTQYLVGRDFGKGILGTILTAAGMLMVAFGVFKLDDEKDKFYMIFGDLKVDITEIFGTSSLLMGASMMQIVKTLTDEDEENNSGITERMLSTFTEYLFEGFILTDLLERHDYDSGAWEHLLTETESVLRSFVPQAWQLFGRVINNEKIDYHPGIQGMFERTVNSIWPAALGDNAVDPYTGELQSRNALPYGGELLKSGLLAGVRFYWTPVSETEEFAKSYGVNKKELTGQITVNDKKRQLNVIKLNQKYGELNANTFLALQSQRHYVQMPDKTYRTLAWKDMSDKQKATVIERTANENAQTAKVWAWTQEGHKYYTTKSEWLELRKLGITENVYLGDKGFVE